MTIFNITGGGASGVTFKDMTSGSYEIKASDWGGHYTRIPQYYFAYDNLLASIEIPQGVTSIGGSAFRSIGTNTTGSVITMLESTPPTLESNAFQSANISKIIVPQGSLTAYQTATNWSAYANLMEEAS